MLVRKPAVLVQVAPSRLEHPCRHELRFSTERPRTLGLNANPARAELGDPVRLTPAQSLDGCTRWDVGL